MKIAILTFQFAYNYGAMLQAYALRKYLISLEHEVDVVPYYPLHLKQGYSISPFEQGISLKHRIYNLLTYWKRAQQALKFDVFKKYLVNTEEFTESDKIPEYLKAYDLLVCGSDQIWNNKITGNTAIYFGGNIQISKMAYAASLGGKILDEVQMKNARVYLPSFVTVSVREEMTRLLLGHIRDDIAVVCDPVFLQDEQMWKEIEKPVKIEEKYLLLYFLEDSKELVERAKEYAKENHLHIYEIHPTFDMHHNGIKILKKIGPAEFIYLIRNASAICTNSFHAVSFSIIFRKKLLHIPNSMSPERTQNILNKSGIELHDNDPFYDLGEAVDRLAGYISESKNFIKESLQKVTLKKEEFKF